MNVEGTRKMLDFAAAMPSLSSFAYVGTAYVAGEREGLMREDELAVGQRFRNTYEQTKAEAEALVRSRMGSLPVRDSASKHHRGRFAHRRHLQLQNDVLAAQDLCATALAHCAGLSATPCWILCRSILWPRPWRSSRSTRAALGSTVHLCAGPQRQRHHRAGRAARGGVLQGSRAALCRSANSSLPRSGRCCFSRSGGASGACWSTARAYRDYFTMRMQFDTTNAERLLGPAGITPAARDGLS